MWIESGSGPIISLYFSVPNLPSGIEDSINSITIEQLETEIEGITIDPLFYEVCGGYTPPTILSGSIGLGCCDLPGDADLSGDVNVADATFIVKFIFLSGAAPPCNDQADAEGGNEVNVADATYIVKYIFQNGLPPICGTTGA